MVKVFFILFSSAAAGSAPVSIAAPAAAETAMNSRRESVLKVMGVKASFPSADGRSWCEVFFVVVPFLVVLRNSLADKDSAGEFRTVNLV
jgi:hypothetical protein